MVQWQNSCVGCPNKLYTLFFQIKITSLPMIGSGYRGTVVDSGPRGLGFSHQSGRLSLLH